MTAVRVAAAGLLTGVLGAAGLCLWMVLVANAEDAANRATYDDWHHLCPCHTNGNDEDDS